MNSTEPFVLQKTMKHCWWTRGVAALNESTWRLCVQFFALIMTSDQSMALSFDAPQHSAHRSSLLKSTRTNDVREMERRSFLGSHFIMALSLLGRPSEATSATSARDICNQGTLVLEQAIPGAYEQMCMQLDQRIVPIHVTIPSSKTVETKYVTLQQGASGAGSTGLAVWNSSLLLARLLEALQSNYPNLFTDRSIVELGCGPGLGSLAAALLGAPIVLATDGNPKVVELARANVKQLQSPAINVQNLSWGLLDAIEYADAADVLIGSDLTYNAGTWRALAETMETILKPSGSILYLTLGHAGFNVNAEVQGFLSVAQEMGLTQVHPYDPTWPFPQLDLQAKQKSLTDFLLQAVVTPQELEVVKATGGVKVVVLQKKRHARK